MSNMPNWLVPEDDRTIPTGALWRQWRNVEDIFNRTKDLSKSPRYGDTWQWKMLIMRLKSTNKAIKSSLYV
jgi:hypothetical protein